MSEVININSSGSLAEPVVMGRVSGVFGTRGWLKIFSYTRPRDNILLYRHWQISRSGGWQPFEVLAHRRQGAGLVASLDGISDRDAAVPFVEATIAVDRSALPQIEESEYYWADLIGLTVVNADGVELGKVTRLLGTGANDVLVVNGAREYLIPYVIDHFVLDVALSTQCILVDWHVDD